MKFSIQTRIEDQLPVITLQNDTEQVSAEIFTLGGLLNAFIVPVDGKPLNLIDGYANQADARAGFTRAFQSVRLSPFVCRMRKGLYSWMGTQYQVTKTYLGDHAIHGLMYDTPFTIAHSKADAEGASVTLAGEYRGEDRGYPFPYRVSITWQLLPDATLRVNVQILHENAFPIPIAEGWHPYFTLGGSVDDCTLQFTTNQKMEYDADLLPTGKYEADNRFLSPCLLKGIELDNGFVWTDPQVERSCVISNGKIRLHILPDNAYPVLQIYIPQHRKSIAIENLSGAPDNFNNGFMLVTLPPHTTASFTTSYQAEVSLVV
ncbi:MAG: aldose 1-epimerase [Sediminibacterium sp.]|nr:aldose 1-epimerase [Sediminibacterium sp.]